MLVAIALANKPFTSGLSFAYGLVVNYKILIEPIDFLILILFEYTLKIELLSLFNQYYLPRVSGSHQSWQALIGQHNNLIGTPDPTPDTLNRIHQNDKWY